MSYGFRITGNDGAPFTVLDTELDTLNLVVTEKGRAMSINLSYPLGPYDFLFVKSPSAQGNANFESETQYPAPATSVYFAGPQYYFMRTNPLNGEITFKGGAYDYYADPYNPRGLPRLALATGWDVEFDYFVVRRSTDVVSQGIGRDDNYGLQVRSKFYTDADPILAYDSRSAITNDSFYIISYLPPATQVYTPGNFQSQYSTLSHGDSDAYVNINWTDRPLNDSGNFGNEVNHIFAIGMTSVSAWAVTGILELEDGGRFFIDGNNSAILAVKLRDPNDLYGSSGGTTTDDGSTTTTAPNEDDVETDYTGTITYVDNQQTLTEGTSIQFDAGVNITDVSYHTRVYPVTNTETNDLDSMVHNFTGSINAERITLTATNEPTNDSRMVSYMRTQNYLGNYTTTRDSSYTRGFLGNFAGDYTRDFAGNYTRNSSYSRNFAGEYTRTSAYGRTLNFQRDFTRDYLRTRTSSYTRGIVSARTSVYSRIRLAYSQNSFVGNYTRILQVPTVFTRTGEYIGNYTPTKSTAYFTPVIGPEDPGVIYVDIPAPFVGNYIRTFVGEYSGAYTRDFTRGVSYEGNYSRNFAGNFAGNYSRDLSFSRNFIGDYARGVVRVSSYTRTRVTNYTGDFQRGSTYVGNYSRNFVGNFGRTIATNKTYSRTRTSAYTPLADYARTSTRTFAGSRIQGFTGNFTRAFTGDYTRASTYARNFVGNYTRGSTTTTNYNRTFVGNYTRTETGVDPYQYSATSGSEKQWIVRPSSNIDDDGFGTGSGGWVLEVKWNGITVFVGDYASESSALNVTVVQNAGQTQWYWKGDIVSSSPFLGSMFELANTQSGTQPTNTTTTSYTRDRVSSYARTTGGATPYSRTRVSTYSRTLTSTRNRGSSYTRVRNVTYNRNRVSSYVGNFTGPSSRFVFDPDAGGMIEVFYSYTRDFVGNYTGEYTRQSGRVITRASTYSRTRSSTLNFTRVFTGDFAGNYSRNITDNPTYSRTRSSTYSRSSAYARTSTRTRTSSYIRTRTDNPVRTSSYSGTYNRSRVSTYTRDRYSTFTRTSTRTLNFAGNTPTETDYTRTRVSAYVGNYTGEYTRDLYFTGNTPYTRNFVGEYARTSVGTFSRSSGYSRTLNFNRTRTSGYARTLTFDRTRTSNYTRDRQSTAGESYFRTFTGNFVGNYIGNYTRTSIGTSSGVSEVKWQGEQFRIELLAGDSTATNPILLDSITFTLFDNDAGTVLATTSVTVSDTDTTHKLLVDFKSAGNQVASGRVTTVAGGVSAIMAGPFDLVDGLNEVTVTNAPQVVSGAVVTYYIHVNNNGTSGYWVPGGSYTVTRVAANNDDGQDPPPDGTPPDSDGTTTDPSGPTDPGDPDGPGDSQPDPGSEFE